MDLAPNTTMMTISDSTYEGNWFLNIICDNRNSPASETFATDLSDSLKADHTYELSITLKTN